MGSSASYTTSRSGDRDTRATFAPGLDGLKHAGFCDAATGGRMGIRRDLLQFAHLLRRLAWQDPTCRKAQAQREQATRWWSIEIG
jgi:hypothetical protein